MSEDVKKLFYQLILQQVKLFLKFLNLVKLDFLFSRIREIAMSVVMF